jgi:CHAT domain-containing protein
MTTPIHPSAQILGLAPFANTDNKLGVLAYSEEELAIIESAINGTYSLDASASLASFLAEAESFPILHLSTHASAQADGGFPRIFFNEKSLLLPDLYTLELPADLVVLSACETGLGEVEVGEGVMSLARGFTYAGAQSLISSLWKVNDRSTAILFQSFYQNLLRGKSKTTALHQSKLDYLMDKERPAFQKSPYYWAGFVHIGGDQVLDLDAKKSLLWIWIGVGVGFLLAIGILRYVVFK